MSLVVKTGRQVKALSNRYLRIALGLVAAVVFTASASAATISGDITFGGDFVPTGGTGLGDATGVAAAIFKVDAVTGDFALQPIFPGDSGALSAFTFSPATVPVSPLWTVGGFSFELTSLSIVFQNASFLILEGAGFITGNGFDSTPGMWSLTANAAGSIYSFSSGSSAVPLPAAAWLFGSAIMGLTVVARRRRSGATPQLSA